MIAALRNSLCWAYPSQHAKSGVPSVFIEAAVGDPAIAETYLHVEHIEEAQWDVKHGGPIDLKVNVSADLATAMKKNPRLKVMVNSGYYDLATPFYAAY